MKKSEMTLDNILEKIKNEGIKSLTKEEIEFIFNSDNTNNPL